MTTIAAILAGGVGSRVGAGVPKQFLPLAGRSVIEYAVDAFDRHPGIDGVVVVVHKQYCSDMEGLVARNHWNKVLAVLPGGAERYHSSLAAIAACQQWQPTNLLLHDAARPLVSQRVIGDVVEALRNCRAVGVGVPATDTIWQAASVLRGEASGSVIASIPDRTALWCAQTPQGFRFETLCSAYEQALKDPAFCPTDDCGVLTRYLPQVAVHIVNGDPWNMKITYPDDLRMAELLLQRQE